MCYIRIRTRETPRKKSKAILVFFTESCMLMPALHVAQSYSYMNLYHARIIFFSQFFFRSCCCSPWMWLCAAFSPFSIAFEVCFFSFIQFLYVTFIMLHYYWLSAKSMDLKMKKIYNKMMKKAWKNVLRKNCLVVVLLRGDSGEVNDLKTSIFQ